jgi:hypothetical protein
LVQCDLACRVPNEIFCQLLRQPSETDDNLGNETRRHAG